MTRHDEETRIRHMLEYARIAVDMAQNRTRRDLDCDLMFKLAATRAVEVVGEAAAQVGPEGRNHYSAIPWRTISDMRNRLIHGYDEVNLDVPWSTIQSDLPPLIEQLERIVGT